MATKKPAATVELVPNHAKSSIKLTPQMQRILVWLELNARQGKFPTSLGDDYFGYHEAERSQAAYAEARETILYLGLVEQAERRIPRTKSPLTAEEKAFIETVRQEMLELLKAGDVAGASNASNKLSGHRREEPKPEPDIVEHYWRLTKAGKDLLQQGTVTITL